MSMDQLRGRLDDAFSAVSPVSAPIEGAIRKGKVIRLRRRTVAAAGIAAVVTAAVFTPLAVHWSASPAPSTGPYTVTVRPPGPHSPPGEIASGTVNGKSWQVIAERRCPGGDGYCILGQGPAFGDSTESESAGDTLANATGLPVYWSASSSGPVQLQLGAVRAGVSAVRVYFGNGTVLTLYPVTVYGDRAVAFAAPVGVDIVRAVAYSRTGEIAAAIPLNLPGKMSYFGSWLTPGERAAASVSGTIGSGTINGVTWSASAYLGPWGICAEISDGSTCVPTGTQPGTGEMLVSPNHGLVQIVGSAAAAVTRLAVSAGRTTVQVRPVSVGGLKFFAVAVPAFSGNVRWVAYDAAGRVVASAG